MSKFGRRTPRSKVVSNETDRVENFVAKLAWRTTITTLGSSESVSMHDTITAVQENLKKIQP